MPEHEQYPNSPLVYVACEIQYPIAPKANRQETFEALTEALADQLPVPVQEERALFVSPNEAMHRQKVFRFVSRDKTRSMSVSQSALTVETTDYPGWSSFRAQVLSAAEVLSHGLVVAGMTRVGVRYVNEVRVPDPIVSISDWARWITPALLQPAESIPVDDPGVFQAVVQSRGTQHSADDGTPGPALTVRYGTAEGPGVVSDEPLKKVRQQGSGSYFLIDIDSFEAVDNLPEFAGGAVEPILEALHDPLDEVFETMITDELRELLRKGK